MKRQPSASSSPAFALTPALLAAVLLAPLPAHAQLWKKIKEVAESADTIKEEIDERVDGEPDEPAATPSCVVTDAQCVARAITEAGAVIVTDENGKVLYTLPASGQPAASTPASSAPAPKPAEAAPSPPPGKLDAEVRMEPLVPADSPIILSDDGAHAAKAIEKGARTVVVVDGREGPVFDKLLSSVVLSPAGGHQAYIGQGGNECVLVVDGETHEPLALTGQGWNAACPIGHLTFNYDGSRVAWVRTEDPQRARSRVVINGVAGPALYTGFHNFSGTSATTHVLLRGDHAYYVGTKPDGSQELVIDGKAVTTSGPVVNQLTVTEDGEHHAFVATDHGAGTPSWSVVADGEVIASPDGPVTGLYLHASGSVAWLGQTVGGSNPEYFLVAEGREFTSPEVGGFFEHFIFSPDGERFAFVVRSFDSKSWTVWVDGEPGPKYDRIEPPKYEQDYMNLLASAPGRQPPAKLVLSQAANRMVQFSADSSRFGYIGRRDQHRYVVVDGEPSEPLTWVGSFYFSAAGDGYVYHARTLSDQDTMAVYVNGKRIDGAPNPSGTTILSPDGSRYAYMRGKDFVIDGTTVAANLWGGNGLRALSLAPVHFPAFAFSPDGARLAYATWDSSRTQVMLDGEMHASVTVPNPSFAAMVYPIFSRDGKHFAYARAEAAGGNGHVWRLMVDGQAGPVFDELVPHRNAWRFVDDDTLRLLAVKDGMVQRVTVEL